MAALVLIVLILIILRLLFRRALEKRIAVMPGAICASGKAYRHCIRVSCGLPYSERIDRGLQTLATLARSLAS